jgi:rhodanese-related sulfurtransferase
MKLDWRLVMIMVLSLGLMVGCTSDDDEEIVPVGTFDDVSTYMQDNGLDLPAMLTDWVIPASSVIDTNDYQTVPDYTVLDIRDAATFAAGHIDGAINTSLGDILTVVEANAAGTSGYLIVCVTGQTAGHATMALRLMGYEAKVLKFGMCGWNEHFATNWNANAGHENGNKITDNANWVYTAAPAVETYEYPDWESVNTDGAAILVERVEAAIVDGFMTAGATTVLGAPENYQILNYWVEADYLTFGHFDGAYQLNPISLAGDEITAIDPGNESAVYCYTGQTSSMVTFWLNVLGYDASSILYGVNTLNYDPLAAAGKPNWHGAADYNWVEG